MVWENSLINGVLKGGVGVCFPDDCLGFFVSMYDVCVHQPEPSTRFSAMFVDHCRDD